MATIDQIAKEELEKQQRRDAESTYLSGAGKSADQPDENLSTEQKYTDKADAVVSPSLDKVVEMDFDYNAAITNINEKYKDLQERIDDPRPFLLSEFQEGDFQLQQQRNAEIVDAKLKYAESKLGAPVKNHNEMGFWVSTLLQRYKTPQGKINAFKYFYPEGDMMEVPIVGTDGKKKVITVYRKNQEEDYGLLYPFGRDINEFGVVGAEVLSARTLGASFAFLLDPTNNPALAAGVGDYMGIKVDKLINWGLGKALGFEGGEGEFQGKDKITDINLLDFSPVQFGEDKGFFGVGLDEDVFPAFLTSAFTKGIGVTTNLLTGQSKPALLPITDELIAIAKELDLPPHVVAQLAINPLIQKTFFRAGDITGFSHKKAFPQRSELYSKFKKYGVSMKADVEEITKKIETQYQNGDFGKIGDPASVAAKNNAINKALQEASDQNSITWQDWATLMEMQTNKLAEAIKPFKITDSAGNVRLVTPAEGYVGLKEAFKEYEELLMAGVTKLRGNVVNNSAGVSYTIGGQGSLKELITELETGTGAFSGSAAKNVGGIGTTNIVDDAGNIISKKIAIDLTDPKNKPLIGLINDIKALDDVIVNPKTNTPNLNAIKGKDSSWDAFSQLEVLRTRAFNLMDNDNPAVRDAARKIHKKIISIMEDNSGKFKNGGSSKYNKSMNLYLQNLKQYEDALGLKDMHLAMSNKMSPQEFAAKYFQPGSGYNIMMLKEALGPDNLNFTAFQQSFKSQLLRDQDNLVTTIQNWQKLDPDGLKALLGDDVDELLKIGNTFEVMNNSVVKKAFENQSSNTVANTKEVVKNIIETAKRADIGDALAIENFIASSGGMNGKVMNNIRSGMIEDILNKSSSIDSKTGGLVINPKQLMAAFKEIGDDPHLKMLFTDDQLSMLGKFEAYTNVIGASSDIGGSLAAAELGGEAVRALLEPKKGLGFLKTFLAYNITARILGRDVTEKTLKTIMGDGLTGPNYTALRSMLGSIIGDFMNDDFESQREIGVGVDVPDAVVSDYPGKEFFPSNPESRFATTTSQIEMGEELQDIKAEENRPVESSSLANPNLGFRNISMNDRANTMERGQQLFKDDITFAAKGGIMNTTKAFQRVA